jgi:pimeloyl-ACP methyl ester carboxylesterase
MVVSGAGDVGTLVDRGVGHGFDPRYHAAMPAVPLEHTTLECVERGRGEPLLFVHGSASDYRTWQRLQESFCARYRTIAYSRRYHWPNQVIEPGADYSMTQHVDDLQMLIATLDAAPVQLVGHSYGAFVCLLLALRQPALVRSLVLIEPPAITLFVGDPPRLHELLRLLATRPRAALALMRFAATGLGPATAAARRGEMDAAMARSGQAVLGPDYYVRMPEIRRAQVRANAIREEFFDSYPPLPTEAVRAMHVPTLLVNGRDSPALFRCVIERLDELLPHSERSEIAGASHIVHEDQPALFERVVADYLCRTTGSSE